MTYQTRRAFGPRNKWNSLRAANRIPEVELERKIAEINRHRALKKRELLVEEGRLWDEMFEDEKLLKTSIARFPRHEVIERLIIEEKERDEEVQPFSEYYRQFIIFKARRMAKMFGKSSRRPPRYSELYNRETAPARNNKVNVELLMIRCRESRKTREGRKLEDVREDRIQSKSADTMAHFPFASDNSTKDFTSRKQLTKCKISPASNKTTKSFVEDDVRGSRQLFVQVKQSAPDAYGTNLYHLPPISDRYKLKSDRTLKKGIEAGQEGHVSPLSEVKRETTLPDIFTRGRITVCPSSESDEGEEP